MLHAHPYLGNWEDRPDPIIEQKVQQLLDAGADIVVGSGPYVPQGVMVKNNKIALLSLGNFVFRTDYQMPQKASNTILAKFIIMSDKIKLELVPLIINNSGIPRIPTNDKALTNMKDLAILSSELGTKIDVLEGKGYIEIAR
jgi:poly-gamma-glutamate capsule biosynthesis protein CapA/YwtB (metallophosphatase superfamily)